MALHKAIYPMEMLIPDGTWREESVESPEEMSLSLVRRKQEGEFVEALRSIMRKTSEESFSSLFTVNTKEKRLTTAKYFVEENYPHVVRRLERLRNFKIPASQVNAIQAAFDHAFYVLYQIARKALGRGFILSEPLTFGTPDNGVQYEWRRGERQFHFEIIPNEREPRYGYLLWPSLSLDDGEEGEFDDFASASPIIGDFLSWMEKGLI